MSNWYIRSQSLYDKDYELLEEVGYPEDLDLAQARRVLDKQFDEKRRSELDMGSTTRRRVKNPDEFRLITFNENYLNSFISFVANGTYQPTVSYFYDGRPFKYKFRGSEYEKLCDQYRVVRPVSSKRPTLVKRLKQLITKSMIEAQNT